MTFESQRLALLDRDGTLIEHIPYLHEPAQVRLLPGVADGLLRLRRAGYALVMVSNQSGVGRGFFSESAVEAVNARLQELLAPHGAALDLMLFCPHAPGDHCACRKPQPGLALQAAERLGLSLSGALVVGDSDCDLELASGLGLLGLRVGDVSFAQALSGVANLL